MDKYWGGGGVLRHCQLKVVDGKMNRPFHKHNDS